MLLDRLGDRLGLLRAGPRDLPQRQQTLRATMDWSYELLEPGEQRLFELLAAFADAEVSAIEAVVDDVGAVDGEAFDVLDGLAGLVEKSLLRRVDAPGREPRVAMLQTIREFAADRLDQHPELASRARRAHADQYAELARRLRAGPHWQPGAKPPWKRSTRTSGTCAIAWAYSVDARDLGHLDGLAKALLALDDAHGWYLDTARLASDMLAVVEAVPPSPDRINQEIGLRTTLARALMTTKGFTPEVEAASPGALDRFERASTSGSSSRSCAGSPACTCSGRSWTGPPNSSRRSSPWARPRRCRMHDGHLLVGTTLRASTTCAADSTTSSRPSPCSRSSPRRPGQHASATIRASPA